MTHLKLAVTTVFLGLLMSACGSTPTDRGVSGAGIGASAGAVLGAVTGMTVVQGAVIGAVAGGLTGALTKEDKVNLGKPAWKQNSTAAAAPAAQQSYAPAAVADQGAVRSIQSTLRNIGLYQGPVDGIAGPKTANAIRAYQQQNGLAVNGVASYQLLDDMRRRGLVGSNV